MIKDLDLLKDITPLFKKELVIWGIGGRGRAILDNIISMGAGKKGIFLCDSSRELQGDIVCGNRVFEPKELKSVLEGIDSEQNIAILVTPISLKVQDEILAEIEELYGSMPDVYTNYAIEWGIYFNINNPCVQNKYREQKLDERRKNSLKTNNSVEDYNRILKYFALLPIYNDEIILIYQPGKVASSTIYNSIYSYGHHALHCHFLNCIESNDLYKILNLKSGKIISLVRDPVAQYIAAMWQNMTRMDRYSIEVNLNEVEKYYEANEYFGSEFDWFNDNVKKNFKIDIYQYPFDKEKGYTIIKEGNIELLLMKMEKLNELESVIGDFCGIENFHLCGANVGKEKAYRFAYQEYKANIIIPKEKLEDIYKKNEYMKHFYTEQERDKMYVKWLKNYEG